MRHKVSPLLSRAHAYKTMTGAYELEKFKNYAISSSNKNRERYLNYSTKFKDKSSPQKYARNIYFKQETNSKIYRKSNKTPMENRTMYMKGIYSSSLTMRNKLNFHSQSTKYNTYSQLPNFAAAKRHANPPRQRRSFSSSSTISPSALPDTESSNWKQSCYSTTHISNPACSCLNNKCDCSNTNFTSVPQDLPTDIIELKMTFSGIKILPSNIFSRYRSLKSLDLSCNKLQLLENGSFSGLHSLNTLDLSKNFLDLTPEQLPVGVFKPLKSLKVLRIDGNGDESDLETQNYTYPDNALAPLTSLEELHLDGLNRKIFGLGFRNMTSLRKLILSSTYCNITSLSNGTFENIGQITFLDISNCHLWGEYLETGTFSPLKNLLVLNISKNQDLKFANLCRLFLGLRNSKLQTLRADAIVYFNDFYELTSSMLDYLPQTLETLIIRWNSMLKVELGVFEKLPKQLKTLDLRDTLIIADSTRSNMVKLPNLEALLMNNQECPTDDPDIRYVPLSENVSFSQHLRKKRFNLLTGSLKRLGINIFNLKLETTMFHMNRLFAGENNIEVVDVCCSYVSDFEFLTLKQFHKLRYLTVRGMSLSKIIPPQTAMTSLQAFRLHSHFLETNLNNNPAPFSFMPNLRHLDLSLDQLSYLHEDLLQGLDHLEYLYLDRNLLSQFDVDISHMTKLKLLNLSNNALLQLPKKIRTSVDQLNTTDPGQIKIDMTNCPIQCDCYNLDFLKWMVNSGSFDINFRGYKCKYPNTSLQDIFDGYKQTISQLEKECAENYPMFLIALGATMVLMFAVVGAILHRLRWKIRYLYYAAYLKFVDKRKADHDKNFEYDVFLSYDSGDGMFVKSLSYELESRGLKLLIHSRDFVAGDYIASNIVKAVTGSKKTLVVLTRKLLASTWCNYEIQMATMETVQTGRQVLVFLLKENIPNKELGVELLRYIRSNTYLPYPSQEEEGDEEIMAKFYDKLTHDIKC